ncbi:aldose 1-epimerase [Clostridium bowmanii]|uniref:aldose 1-epimerase n=1 Tax=Clostridium bowmanii TaxID=132925 RepID=UPI001C0AAA9A|nr:aldose 1-epimerase [Clostridium bowmanii]MBU3190455.1 aldose 1-epimerase [Clostridium bowmanii]MCA1074483.1 aldose 1-epimerase [Clostridium bowmanii]
MTNGRNKIAATIQEESWKGYKSIRFSAGGYEALMITDMGANIIELKDSIRGLSLLRTPVDEIGLKVFKAAPQVYGLPVLFPPNRIEDGSFKMEDKVYKFPINEPKHNNYIHGFIKNEKWKIARSEIIRGESVEIEAVFDFNEEHEFYKYFPHAFQFKLVYNLSSNGLKQKASIINLSSEKMPMGIGFHSAFNIPFHPESMEEDYRLIISIDKRWEQDWRNLPTGKILDLTIDEKQYVCKGINPLEHSLESHYTTKDMNINGKVFHGAIIEDTSKKLRLIYEMGNDYKHMVIWNDKGDKNYVCVEPQTCAINAVNINLENSITGFKTLLTNETWSEQCKIYVEDM